MTLKSLLALTCFILSQGTIAISYLVSLQYMHEKVESCNPFIQGCLNITDAGIYSPEGFIFRGGMIAACAFFIMWWAVSFQHINTLLNRTSKLNISSTALGIIGAICLIVATAVLIPPRSVINWDLHTAGAILFFLISFVAQALHCFICYRAEIRHLFLSKSLKAKLINVIIQGLMIATALTLKWLDTGGDIGNAIEWWLALLIALYFLASFWDWQKQA